MDNEPRSIWDQEPRFLRWNVATWEHAAHFPQSYGIADSVRNSKRLLPNEVTGPIYAALVQFEEAILRRTEPIPPLKVRLLREVATSTTQSVEAAEFSYSVDIFDDLSPQLHKRISEFVPDWNNVV